MAFTEITGAEYTRLLLKRLHGEVPELTWLKQCKALLSPRLHPGITMLDVGCATGYAYNTFRDMGLIYTGVDIEQKYLDAAMEAFSGVAEASFCLHDITSAPLQNTADIVICSAVLEHCPGLMPSLSHLTASAERVLILRTFLGQVEEIHTIPSPVLEYRDTHVKYNNQYSFKDVLSRIEGSGFKTRLYRDEYTDSIPQLVDNAVRTFYVIYAERPSA